MFVSSLTNYYKESVRLDLSILIDSTWKIEKRMAIQMCLCVRAFVCVCVCVFLGAGLWELLTGGFLGGDAHGLLTGNSHPGTSVPSGVCLHRPTDEYNLGYTQQQTTRTFKTQATEECWRSGTVAKKWLLFSLFGREQFKTPRGVWPPLLLTDKSLSLCLTSVMFSN